MSFKTLKALLNDKSYISNNSFEILKEISLYTNSIESKDKGRELVIRALNYESAFKEHRSILYSLVSSVGLFPYLNDYLKDADIIDLLAYELHRPVNMPVDMVFHSMQLMIFQEVYSGRNVVLSASTSVGKSLIIDALIASMKFQSIVLVVPTIALIDETRKRISERFKGLCKVITHPSQEIDKGQQRIYVLTQERVLERNDLIDIDLFVIDEFYKLDLKKDTDNRAIQLNLALYKLLKCSKQFYLIGPNIDHIIGLQKLGKQYLFIPSNFTTVAVNVESFNYTRDNPLKKDKLKELCSKLDDSILIYCQSPRSANTVALTLLEENYGNKPFKELNDVIEWISKEYHKDWIFVDALKAGIGIHHGGIPRALQQYVLKLFNQKKIKYLICTSTIIEGVNTVAKNVIVFDRRKNTALLDYFTYKNIEGRAGRMGQYFVGNVYSMEVPPQSELSTVTIPLGDQNSQTPLNLLLNLDKDDLTKESQLRVEQEINLEFLSLATIRKNISYSQEQQNGLAKEIYDNILRLSFLLNWNNFPTNEQLKATCSLIYNHLEGQSLKYNSILSGDDLHRHVVILLQQRGFSGYLKSMLKSEAATKSASDIVEESLKIARNVFCFSFPRALRALESIHQNVFARYEILNYGTYNKFASEIENLFMEPVFFALDEYGIPLQTATILNEQFKNLVNPKNLDEVLKLLATTNFTEIKSLTRFEKTLLEEIKSTL